MKGGINRKEIRESGREAGKRAKRLTNMQTGYAVRQAHEETKCEVQETGMTPAEAGRHANKAARQADKDYIQTVTQIEERADKQTPLE
ncbi:hypothetical protein Pmani_039689 [Petrolisthes manimaculis]|uniref:Uncharacterized protein n=1 Tax=Petrolisthes manimaculis TaxID=1843537 RepID=A0AAE1TJ98_9EUCA|nr:hypothetical protein Pmani_039689 [Petrolisthes manimaculis]